MASFTIVESATANTTPGDRRQLRCPSCCTRVKLADIVPGDWRVLHRCGDHVLEAAARIWGAPGAWRWRLAQR